MRFEGIDVSKCCVSDACGRMTIVQHLPHILPALAHHLEPLAGNCPQLARMVLHPCINGWISLYRAAESEQLAHDLAFTLTLENCSARPLQSTQKVLALRTCDGPLSDWRHHN